MTFFLQAELTINTNGAIEKNRYEFLFYVELLTVNEKDACFYDRDLKMHFLEPNMVAKTYEVETNKIILKLSSNMEKAEDFTRRLMYRYDRIQPTVRANGKIIGIENKKELKETWQEIKRSVQNEYVGETVTNYLKKLDLEFETDKTVYPALSQYLFFGLLFPAIPETHGTIRERKRTVELSPYEEEQFEEQAVYAETHGNERMYNITGSLLPGSEAELERFEGYAVIPVKELLPAKTVINTSIKKHGIISQWNFNLERY